MKLLYTGAGRHFGEQNEAVFSLGGFVSSSEVPNDTYSALFGEITQSIIKNNNAEHICIALQPEANLTNIVFSIKVFNDSIAKYRIAASLIEMDECEKFGIPIIKSIYSKPTNQSFTSCTSVYGETKFILNQNLIKGETLRIFEDFELIAEVIYSDDFSDIEYTNYGEENFILQTRFDFESKKNYLVLIQKNLVNFNSSIEITRSDSSSAGTVENVLPKINEVGLGDVNVDQLLAIYIERTIDKKVVSEASKNNCEHLFSLFNSEGKLETTENIELEFEYDQETPTFV